MYKYLVKYIILLYLLITFYFYLIVKEDFSLELFSLDDIIADVDKKYIN